MSDIHLSASLYQQFLICPKSAVFSLDSEARNFSKPSLRAALGNVSHKLIENSVRVPQDWNSDQINLWFENNWEAFVEEQHAELVGKWAPNIAPKPQSWPGYFATRAAAKTLVLKNSGLLPPKSPAPITLSPDMREAKAIPLPLVEKFLVSSELGIVGKPDFVFLENSKATIYDYKFGNNQVDLEKHRFQMYFYHLLVESVVKIQVGRLAIVASSNRVWEISSDVKQIEDLKNDIPRVLEALKSGKVVALPSTQNCKFCPFKSICEPFKKSNIEIYPHRPMAIYGAVLHTRNIDENFQELSINPDRGPIMEEIKVFGIPKEYDIKVGDSVMVSDNLDFVDEKIIGFSWNSRITLQS
jgi:hypothetical protein